MTTAQTTNKLLYEVTPGTEIGTWGPYINTDMSIIDNAFGGQVSYTFSPTTGATMTTTDTQNLRINITGNTGSSSSFVGNGYISGTTLTITSVVSGALTVNALITGTGVTAGTTIISYGTGTGGTGTYTVGSSQTAGTSTAPITITATGGTLYLTLPSGIAGMWIAINNTTGTSVIYALTSAANSTGVYLTQGVASLIYSDGTNVYFADGRVNTGLIGATGGGSDQIFFLNGQTVTADYTIPSADNAMTAGPISINPGVTVTIGSTSTWTIV